MTTEQAEQPTEESGWSDGLMRLLSITWPKNRRTVDGNLVAASGALVELKQADTGEFLAATSIALKVDVRDGIIATLTMFTDEDGNPCIGRNFRESYDADGTVRTGTFKWLVVENITE